MADKSKIEWTEATWNPIRGCSLVSQGCKNCYAMRVASRFAGVGQPYEGLAKQVNGHPAWTGEVRFVEKHLHDPLHWKTPRRIFVNSMSDLFHEKLSFDDILRVFAVMQKAHWHTFQVLTKRPHRMLEFCGNFGLFPVGPNGETGSGERIPPNVWLGVSCEDQKTIDERVPLLLRTPAAVRWISAEPLLGPIDLKPRPKRDMCLYEHPHEGECRTTGGLDWVVVGGESGPGARPMHPDWARSLRDQCQTAGVPFFFKQWGEFLPEDHCDRSNGQMHFLSNKEYRRVGLSGGNLTCGVPAYGIGTYRVGKKAAGRLLDGSEWNEYPAGEEKFLGRGPGLSTSERNS